MGRVGYNCIIIRMGVLMKHKRVLFIILIVGMFAMKSFMVGDTIRPAQ